MKRRSVALGVAVFGIAFVVAQDVVPTATFFHTWQYATALTIGALVLAGYVRRARSGADGEGGRRLTYALAGALVAIVTGIVSGLLGPDTTTIVRAPGSVVPLPDVRAAAFFPNVDAAALARGDARVVVRRRGKPDLLLEPNAKRFIGATVLLSGAVPAAFVEVRDLAGNRLTVTQPANAAFLSPVLLFSSTASIGGRRLPLDTFAAPAAHRSIKAMYFTEGDSGRRQRGVVFAVDDDSGRLVKDGIRFAPSGVESPAGGLRLRATLGMYPSLVVASAPHPLPLALGVAGFLAGVGYAAWRGRTAAPAAARAS